MKVRMLRSVADGTGTSYGRGQVVDIDDDLARAWVGCGAAESAAAEPKTATRQAPRRTVKRK